MIPYFSFGHNTNISELYKRIPDAKLMGAASLHGYRLTFEHYANIVPDSDSKVQGVLWGIPVNEIHKLDWDEAYGKHYKHKIVKIQFHGKTVKALAYVMLPDYEDTRLPPRRYIKWIEQGYRDNRIPLSQLYNALP